VIVGDRRLDQDEAGAGLNGTSLPHWLPTRKR
jgi:hypothetical protein